MREMHVSHAQCVRVESPVYCFEVVKPLITVITTLTAYCLLLDATTVLHTHIFRLVERHTTCNDN